MSLKNYMKKTLRDYFRLLRPRQWVKNFAIFAAITFTGQLFDFTTFLWIFYGFLIFCAISSGIYIINDLFDIHKDRLHPFKRFRPLANGDVPVSHGIVLATVLLLGSVIASLFISPGFFGVTILYLLLQVFYSAVLKNIAVIDILALASGYIIRVFAGEIISGFHNPVWLLLTTISLSLFLAVGKRRRELTLVSEHNSANIRAIRESLSHYSERLLDVYLSIFATSTFLSYSLFTFLGNSKSLTITNDLLLPEYLPSYLQRKWLMVTIPFVVYGLMRYLQDIYERHEGESPEKVLFTDKPLLATVIIWMVLVIGITYILGG